MHQRKDISAERRHFTVTKDWEREIFLSDKTLQRRYVPIPFTKKTYATKHVFFCEELHVFICEDLHCFEQKNIALRGGNNSFECAHEISSIYCARMSSVP